jgi:hypothetical protein
MPRLAYSMASDRVAAARPPFDLALDPVVFVSARPAENRSLVLEVAQRGDERGRRAYRCEATLRLMRAYHGIASPQAAPHDFCANNASKKADRECTSTPRRQLVCYCGVTNVPQLVT